MKAARVLIIEDEPALLRGLKDNFETEGYEVRTAQNGQKGLDALLQDPPDLLLLDLMLPKVNGYEICRAARARQLDLPIIMLTARGQEDDIVRGLELGADDYVTKPFSILDAVWGQEVIVTDRSVDRCVTTLRAKIEDEPRNPVYIQTIRDIGYRFETPP